MTKSSFADNLVRLDRGSPATPVPDDSVTRASADRSPSSMRPALRRIVRVESSEQVPIEETMTQDESTSEQNQALRDIPVDWEALEDAFENNAPEVHSYLHLATGDVLRVVDGVADPQMHARISIDAGYLRVEPVSSREQYRWMERFIPMVEDDELQKKLTQAIDGKGAFRRFKDVLMSYAADRERWFTFRSERLRIFMEAWLAAHALNPVARVVRPADSKADEPSEPNAESREQRRGRNAESLRKSLREIADSLGPRDLDNLVAFAEFVRARRVARSFSHHPASGDTHGGNDEDSPASQEVPTAAREASGGHAE